MKTTTESCQKSKTAAQSRRSAKTCKGYLSGHARGRKLEALWALTSLARRNKQRFVWASSAWLAKRLECSARWARKVLEGLEHDGWIVPCEARGQRGFIVLSHDQWGAERASCAFYSGTKVPPGGTKLPASGTKVPPGDSRNDTNLVDQKGVIGFDGSLSPEYSPECSPECSGESAALLLWKSLEISKPIGNRCLRRAVEEKAASARWRSGLGKVVGIAEVGESERVGLWGEIRAEFDARREAIPYVVLGAIEEHEARLLEMRDTEEDKFKPPPINLTTEYLAEQRRKHREMLATVFERLADGSDSSEEDDFKPPPRRVEPVTYERKT